MTTWDKQMAIALKISGRLVGMGLHPEKTLQIPAVVDLVKSFAAGDRTEVQLWEGIEAIAQSTDGLKLEGYDLEELKQAEDLGARLSKGFEGGDRQ